MIQVVYRTFEVLEYIASAPTGGRTTGEIAAYTGLNPATCARIAKTLLNIGYIDQPGPRKGYVLGTKAFKLSTGGGYKQELSDTAKPYLKSLSDLTNETTMLVVTSNIRREVVCVSYPEREVTVSPDAINRTEFYPTATGRMLMAEMDTAGRERLIGYYGIPEKSWEGVSDKASFMQQLDKIRDAGICFTSDKSEDGTVGVSVPVKHGKKCVAALGLFMPKYRYTDKSSKLIISEIQKTADKLSACLQ